jgi:hypothetical protein
MGVEARRHINAGFTKDSRARLLDFYDTVALVEDHDDVDIDDFQQLSQRFREGKSKKKRDLSEATAALRRTAIPLVVSRDSVVAESKRLNFEGKINVYRKQI